MVSGRGFFCAVAILLTVSVAADELCLPEFVWSASKGGKVISTADAKQLRFNHGTWIYARPKQSLRFDGFGRLTFHARTLASTPKRLEIRLVRLLPPKDSLTYRTEFSIGQEWQEYTIFLRRGNEYPVNGACSYFAEAQSPAEHDLGRGGFLQELVFLSSPGAVIEIIPGSLGPEIMPPSKKVRPVLEHMKTLPLVAPFRFAEVGAPDAILLAENGVAHFKVSAAPGLEFAASELCRILKQATGADFHRTSDKDLPQIQLKVVPVPGPDTFQSTGRSNGIVITGNSRRALLFGVYAFLEKAAGVRWFTPFPHGELIPHLSKLSLPEFSDASTARIPFRRMHYCMYLKRSDALEHAAAVADWAVKNRFNIVLDRFRASPGAVTEFYRKRGDFPRLPDIPAHNYHALIPPARYGKTHPEYYAFNRDTGKYQVKDSQLCVTNREVIRLIAKKAADFFRNNPGERLFPLLQEDGHARWCQCRKCEAVMPTTGGTFAGSSERNVYLANQVMEILRPQFPDKGVIIFAYSFSIEPPRKLVPAPGVEVLYCFYSDDKPQLRPWETDDAELFLRWKQYPEVKLWYYSYHYLHQHLRMATPEALTGAFRFFASTGLAGSVQESQEYWGAPDGYLTYLGARLGWEPFLDEKELRRDYFSGLYGAGGAEVQRAFELLCDAMISRSGKLLYVGWMFFPAFSDEQIAKINACYVRAAKAVQHDVRAKKALEDARLYFRNLVLTVYAARTLDMYYRNPSPEAYRVATQALNQLDASGAKLFEQHLMADFGKGRILAHWREILDKAFHRDFPTQR